MVNYLVFPKVDGDHVFPPEVRQAIADSPEIAAKVPSIVEANVPAAVSRALAKDTAPAAAAATAVANAMAAKSLAELAPILEDTLIFSIVDEDGRRTELELGQDGKFTQRVVDSLSSRISPSVSTTVKTSLGISDISTEISGLGFAVVDEDDRRTELEVGPDGKFTQRVITSLSNRLTYPAPPADPAVPILASMYPMVVGKVYKLYYADMIEALAADHHVLTPNTLGNLGSYWQFTPTVPTTFTLMLKIVDRVGATVKSASIPVTVYAAPSGANKRHLAIGDSITRAGNYSKMALAPLTGAVTVGTRTYDDGQLNVEGRGGWSLSTYFTQIGSSAAGDSPFLFPTTIAGAKFWGNTEFWRKVCYVSMATLPTNGYDFDGFQKIARNWTASGGAWLFNSTGYPNTPAEGDVVIDPTKVAGSQWLQYTSGSWVVITTPSLEFNFSKYMARYASAFSVGNPTSISIMLETNDFFGSLDDSVFAAWKTRMDTVISSVRTWSSTVPFIICLAPTGGPAANWSGQTVQKFEFDERIRNATQRIIAAYDNQANRDNKVYVTSFLGSVSQANMLDHVHPNTTAGTGHEEMSAPLSGMLAKLITEGVS